MRAPSQAYAPTSPEHTRLPAKSARPERSLGPSPASRRFEAAPGPIWGTNGPMIDFRPFFFSAGIRLTAPAAEDDGRRSRP